MSPGGPRVRAVIVAHGCAQHLERTLRAWQAARARAGVEAETALVLPEGDPGRAAAARVAPEARLLAPGVPDTPGANRNAGAAGAGAELFLFLDGDVEMDESFLARGLAYLEAHPRSAAYGGRLDERQWRDGREVAHLTDILDAGGGREAEYLAPVWLCRREAFEQAGGFDPRLPSEEDFELGLRLRRLGWRLWMDGAPAGTHHCAPRPSFDELGRRWRRGMYGGPGLALRHAWGSGRFGELLRRQARPLAAVSFALAGPVAVAAAALGDAAPLVLWLGLAVAGFLVLAARKRSPRLALLAALTWVVQGAAVAAAWITGSPPGAARGAGSAR